MEKAPPGRLHAGHGVNQRQTVYFQQGMAGGQEGLSRARRLRAGNAASQARPVPGSPPARPRRPSGHAEVAGSGDQPGSVSLLEVQPAAPSRGFSTVGAPLAPCTPTGPFFQPAQPSRTQPGTHRGDTTTGSTALSFCPMGRPCTGRLLSTLLGDSRFTPPRPACPQTEALAAELTQGQEDLALGGAQALARKGFFSRWEVWE